MKRELLIKGVLTAWRFPAKPMTRRDVTDALSRVSFVPPDLPTPRRRDSGGESRLPKALSLETKVLLCLDAGVWALRRHLIAPASWECCVWGWLHRVTSGPQGISEPGGMGTDRVCCLSSAQAEKPGPTPKTNLDKKADLGYLS